MLEDAAAEAEAATVAAIVVAEEEGAAALPYWASAAEIRQARKYTAIGGVGIEFFEY